MAIVPVTPEQHRRLVALVADRAEILTDLQRENFLEECGLAAYASQLTFGTDARTFAGELVRDLQEAGTMPDTGKPALVCLLEGMRDKVQGHSEDLTFIDGLLAQPYRESTITFAPDTATIAPDFQTAPLPIATPLTPTTGSPMSTSARSGGGVTKWVLIGVGVIVLLLVLNGVFNNGNRGATVSPGTLRPVSTRTVVVVPAR